MIEGAVDSWGLSMQHSKLASIGLPSKGYNAFCKRGRQASAGGTRNKSDVPRQACAHKRKASTFGPTHSLSPAVDNVHVIIKAINLNNTYKKPVP